MNREAIQEYLTKHNLDGWLLVDFHGYNTVFTNLLAITGMLTRRALLYIPAEGEPTAVVHAIERSRFDAAVGNIITYSGYRQFESELASLVTSKSRIAMEYSPSGRLQYIAKVDAGTIELVRKLGAEIVSSADLVANFQARLDNSQIADHRAAAKNLFEIKDKTFQLMTDRLRAGQSLSEFETVEFMLSLFDEHNMTTDHSPNCSFASNAGNPHYQPDEETSALLKRGDLVLIDLWAKLETERAVYGDITWMAFAGKREEIPPRYDNLFNVITTARDAAIDFLSKNIGEKPVSGSQVDSVCRDSIVAAGYGENFTHRTGHSITTSVHGEGPNIDNLESEDSRILKAGHLFSIEPGIYFEDCGMRTEVDGLITETGIEINPIPLQTEIVALLSG